MSRYAAASARISLGIVFGWFGALKLFGASPAADLVARLVGPVVDADSFLAVLGIWEVAIGACLIAGGARLTRLGLLLLFAQLPGTFLPVILLPDVVFSQFPFELTLEGQYIAKNLVLVSAALVVGGTTAGETNDQPISRIARTHRTAGCGD